MPAVKIQPPADLTQPCVKLPIFNGRDMQDIVEYTRNLMKLYKVCSLRQEALAKVVQ